jgi:hypothetical protein
VSAIPGAGSISAHPYFLPVRIGLGLYLQRYHAELSIDTPAIAEFAARDFAQTLVMAPGRMIDQAGEMLDAWRANDNAGDARPRSPLPVMIAALSRDFVPVAPDGGGHAWADKTAVRIPADPKRRMFQLRTVSAEVRAQVVFAAADPLTTQSLAMQLHMHASQSHRRSFPARYMLAGMVEEWPVRIESSDIISVASPSDAKNLTVQVADLTLRVTIPMLSAPRLNSADADGQGTDDMMDPSGYLGVQEVRGIDPETGLRWVRT